MTSRATSNPRLGDSLTSVLAIVKTEPPSEYPHPTPAASPPSPPKPYEAKSGVFTVQQRSYNPSQTPHDSASSRADALIASVFAEQPASANASGASASLRRSGSPNLPAAADGGPLGTNGVVAVGLGQLNGDTRLAPNQPAVGGHSGQIAGMQTPVLGSGLSAEDSGELLRKLFELTANVAGGKSGLYTPQQSSSTSERASAGPRDLRAPHSKSPPKRVEATHSHDKHNSSKGRSSVGGDRADDEELSANGHTGGYAESKHKRHESSRRNTGGRERHQWGDNPLFLDVPNLPLEIQKEILKRIEADHADLVLDVAQCEEKLEACNADADKLKTEVQNAEAQLAAKKEAWEMEKKEKHKIEGILRWLTKKMIANKEDMKSAREKLKDLEKAEGKRRKRVGHGDGHEHFGPRNGADGGETSHRNTKVEITERPSDGRRASHTSGSYGEPIHPPFANGTEPFASRSGDPYADRGREWHDEEQRGPHLKRGGEEPIPQSGARAYPPPPPPPFPRYPVAAAPRNLHPIPPPRLSDICFDFNAQGDCAESLACPLRHTCIICSGPHAFINCATKRQICFKWNQGRNDGCTPTETLLCSREHRCLRCAEWGHRLTECRVVPYPEHEKEDFCLVWNSCGKGKGCSNGLCGRLHRCLRCRGAHPVLVCPENAGLYFEEFTKRKGVEGGFVAGGGGMRSDRMAMEMGPPPPLAARGMSMPPPGFYGHPAGAEFAGGRYDRGEFYREDGFHEAKRFRIG